MPGAIRAPGVQSFRELEAQTCEGIEQAFAVSAQQESAPHQTLTTLTGSCHPRRISDQHDAKQDAGVTCWTD